MSEKRRPLSSEEAEELVGGGGLLDRIGRKEPIVPNDTLHGQQATPTARKRKKKEESIKLSLYLSPSEVNALDHLVIKQRSETGRSPRRNQLIREAVQAYLKKQS